MSDDNKKSDNPFLRVGGNDSDQTVTAWSKEKFVNLSDQRAQEKKQYEVKSEVKKPFVDPEEVKKIQFTHQEKSPVPMLLAVIGAVLVLGVGGVYVSGVMKEKSVAEAKEKAIVHLVSTNTKEEKVLIDKATAALKDGRIDHPYRDNALYFLSQVLENNRLNESAVLMGRALFDSNIAKARKAFESRDVKDVTLLLNQASQLSYYLDYKSGQEVIQPLRQAAVQLRLNR